MSWHQIKLQNILVQWNLHCPLELRCFNESPAQLSEQRQILQPKELHETSACNANVTLPFTRWGEVSALLDKKKKKKESQSNLESARGNTDWHSLRHYVMKQLNILISNYRTCNTARLSRLPLRVWRICMEVPNYCNGRIVAGLRRLF